MLTRSGNHRLACIRRAVPKLGRLLPTKYIERLEQDQKLTHCCRHPENHDVEAWFTNAVDEKNGTPDLYVLICTCGKRHNFFCVGSGERPVWEGR